MNYRYITSQSGVEEILPKLFEQKVWGIDTETTGLDPFVHKPILLQIGRPEEQYIIDIRKVDIESLRPFFESEEIKKVGHNLKFDYKMLKANHGIETECMRDTMLAEKLLNVGKMWGGFGLDDTLKRRLQVEMDKALQKSFIGHKGDFSEAQLAYAAKDVAHLCPLIQSQTTDILKAQLEYTFLLECQAMACFADMELAGNYLDVDGWKKIIDENTKKAEELKKQMGPLAGEFWPQNLFGEIDINWDSPKQVLDLFKRMRIKIKEKNPVTGEVQEYPVVDTKDATLGRIRGYPMIDMLRDYRSYRIRVTTFGQSFIDAIHPVTGRIHPDVDQLGTETGRPATHSSSPVSLLNVPREKAMRNCFVAGKDHVIETDDFSGCELRIWAEISRDPRLTEAFKTNQDLHCYVATKLYGVEVTKKNENAHLRTPAKTLNFGIAYGMGPKKLYHKLNDDGFAIEMQDCRELFRKYETEFRTGISFLRTSGKKAVEQGYLHNLNGRRRSWLIPNPADERYPQGFNDPAYLGRIGGIEREGGNFKIQSVNADITKYAMVLIRNHKKKHKVRTEIINQVYDEIVTRTHKDDSEEFHKVKTKLMLEAAERWLKTVPMEVEGTALPYWTK